MSYIELIVVLSIFAAMTSVVLFNYGDFQAKVDIKNLASDIALKGVEAQKLSLAGKLPPPAQQALISSPLTWKPSYGIYFNQSTDDKSFIFFTDANQNELLDDTICAGTGECLDKILITRNNRFSRLDVFYQGDSDPHLLNDLLVIFKRPNAGAIIKSSTSFTSTVSYVQITVVSPKPVSALIKIYPSGRIQIN